jgi:hypothetical protein
MGQCIALATTNAAVRYADGAAHTPEWDVLDDMSSEVRRKGRQRISLFASLRSSANARRDSTEPAATSNPVARDPDQFSPMFSPSPAGP